MQKSFILSILFSFFSLFSLFANSKTKGIPTNTFYVIDTTCSANNVTIKTQRTEKDRKFLFWKLPHKKIIVRDQVTDAKGNSILKGISIDICSTDACDGIRYRRIKITANEILLFYYNRNPEKAIIKRYDFCGNYLGKKIWDKEVFYE
ncbi:hypothetical protein D0809_21005 [Flavobacterium circumlabens]|uniref:Uncharacterized protein n=1 Tax=Flavobacterium circumlabens TaxID=2133765 RepID=A0A4Y7U7F1_9FLAO|nr:hypothetical protein [Flavobacterium circumlabens]TCN53069.1 hypothetical protein EV142_10952 [Flavobacterium circumlabens]TEB42376.1 hypothetical protein D0809_21005 [Flavobacterium circumlabens]